MEHTPGPWEAKAQKAARYWKAEVRTPDKKDDEGHYSGGGQLIAVCYGQNTVANAHLIAAAPDMHQKLLKVCKWLDTLIDQAEAQLFTCRFITLREALEGDIKNYKVTKADIELALAKAETKGE